MLQGRCDNMELACRVVLAYLIAALSPTLEVASCALPTYTLMLAFFTGLPIRPKDQPAYWHW